MVARVGASTRDKSERYSIANQERASSVGDNSASCERPQQTKILTSSVGDSVSDGRDEVTSAIVGSVNGRSGVSCARGAKQKQYRRTAVMWRRLLRR